MGEITQVYKISDGKLKVRDDLDDLGLDERIILE
jgi:hypothetical protein